MTILQKITACLFEAAARPPNISAEGNVAAKAVRSVRNPEGHRVEEMIYFTQL